VIEVISYPQGRPLSAVAQEYWLSRLPQGVMSTITPVCPIESVTVPVDVLDSMSQFITNEGIVKI